MADVLGTLSAATALAGTIGKLVGQLSGVKDETGTVIDQLRRINDDINEARRLRYVKALNLGDHDTARIDRVIHDSTLAVLKIAKQVEPSRVGVATTGTVNLVDRFDWVSRKSSTVTGYQHNLQTCHQSLQGELGYLRQKLFVAGLAFPEQTPPPYEDIYPEVSDKHEQARRGRAHRRHGHRNGNEDLPIDISDEMGTSPRVSSAPPTSLDSERALYIEMQELEKWRHGR